MKLRSYSLKILVLACLSEFCIIVYAGSVLSGGGSPPQSGASAKDWVDMVDGFQKSALESRLAIPMLYGVDAVHGHNNVAGATIFPHNIGLGATRCLFFLPCNCSHGSRHKLMIANVCSYQLTKMASPLLLHPDFIDSIQHSVLQ